MLGKISTVSRLIKNLSLVPQIDASLRSIGSNVTALKDGVAEQIGGVYERLATMQATASPPPAAVDDGLGVVIDKFEYGRETIGVARDHIGTPILGPNRIAIYAREDVKRDLEHDNLPLPPTERREMYQDSRHLEHWLSGRYDAEFVVASLSAEEKNKPLTVLDFGGATGRVIRHMPALLGPDNRYIIADAKEAHVAWVNTHLAPTIIAFQSRYQPPLAFPDHSVDVAFAFSIFTHIYEFETAWLMELKRVLKPGGLLYVTIHDEETWKTLEQSVFHPWFTSKPEIQEARQRMPNLSGRFLYTHLRAPDGTRIADVFHSHDYIRKLWSQFFTVEGIYPRRHDHQAGVVLRT
jgi:ubiquinone/menaquinone biosynthesis C-methylase UbiE